MRVGLALALVSSLLAAGCLQAANVEPNATADAASLAAGLAQPLFEEGYVFGLLDVEIDPTLTIHAETFLPITDKPLAGAEPAEAFPTVVVMSPYFGAGTGGGLPGHHLYDYLIENMVPRGYAVVLADTAGQGGSSGCWDFMGPNEVRGAAGLIDAIAQQPWSDGKVGMVGKSYDAMTQIMAASKNPEALVTVVPVAPLTHAYAGMYQNGVHYGGGWHATTAIYQSTNLAPPGADPLSLAGGGAPTVPTERYPGWGLRVATSPTCMPQNLALSNDPTGAYNAYFAERDLRPSAASVKASVFFMQGFLDANVKPDNLLPYFSDLPGPKKAWLGQWHHDYPNATWAGREDMYLTMHRWFDHELKGIQNGIDQEPVVDVQDSLGRWRHEDAWPPADAAMLSIPFGDATVGGPASAATDAGAELASEVAGVHVAGIPRVTFSAASDRPTGQVVAKLFSGERLVSQGALNLQFAAGLDDMPEPLTPGAPVEATLEMYPTDFAVPADAPLVLRLYASDPDMWYDPDVSGATLTLTGVTVEIPTIERTAEDVFLVACGERIMEEVPECYLEGRVDIGLEPAEG